METHGFAFTKVSVGSWGAYCAVVHTQNPKLYRKLKRRKALHSNGSFRRENSAIFSDDLITLNVT